MWNGSWDWSLKPNSTNGDDDMKENETWGDNAQENNWVAEEADNFGSSKAGRRKRNRKRRKAAEEAKKNVSMSIPKIDDTINMDAGINRKNAEQSIAMNDWKIQATINEVAAIKADKEGDANNAEGNNNNNNQISLDEDNVVDASTTERIMMTKRLVTDLNDFKKGNSPWGIFVHPSDYDITFWTVEILAPIGSAFEGGLFQGVLEFPNQFPYKQPNFSFLSEIFHPNISKSGKVCLDNFNWSPCHTIWSFLASIQFVLADANSADFEVLNTEAAAFHKNDLKQYEEFARQNVIATWKVYENEKAGKPLNKWLDDYIKNAQDQEAARIVPIKEEKMILGVVGEGDLNPSSQPPLVEPKKERGDGDYSSW